MSSLITSRCLSAGLSFQLTPRNIVQRSFHSDRYVPHAAHIMKNSTTISSNSEEIAVTNPATDQDICRVISASTEDVKKAIDNAQTVFDSGVWSKSASFRSSVLSKMARALDERIPEMAKIETLQTGRTIREMTTQLGRLSMWLDYFSALLLTKDQAFVTPGEGNLLTYVQRVPLGVVAQITPFNHPLLIAVKKIAPALAAGNCVVVKPSELAPISVLEFAKMAEEVGLPSGVLSVLPGFGITTGTEIVKNPLVRKVDITAGTQTGRALGSIVGSNLAAFTAELGGKAPIVIFDDADLISAVNGAAFASFIASGQTCVSGTRIIIQDKIYDEFMERLLQKIESIRRRMGNPMNPKSTMGTVISMKHLERIEQMIKRRTGGDILTGGERMLGTSELDGFDFSQGSFFPPTVISDVDVSSTLWREEIFGPVIVVKRFLSETEGIVLANDCKYGLGAGIWTSNLSRAHRVAAEIQAGLCWVNTHHRNSPSSPWGGMKESGIGRENGLEAFESYSQSKSTIINLSTAEDTRRTDDWFAEDDIGARYG